jgi:hypothetical protein
MGFYSRALDLDLRLDGRLDDPVLLGLSPLPVLGSLGR